MTVTRRTRRTGSHRLHYVESGTVQYTAEATDAGDVRLTGGPETLDIEETSIWCDDCGRLAPDEYAAHGIGEEWNQV